MVDFFTLVKLLLVTSFQGHRNGYFDTIASILADDNCITKFFYCTTKLMKRLCAKQTA